MLTSKIISGIICLSVVFCFLGCERKTQEVAREDIIEEFEMQDAQVNSALRISSGVLVVDDFNDGDKPNSLGGDFGSWDKDPNDSTQYCRDSFDSEVKIDKTGYSLRLGYDVDSHNPAYNGFWSRLNNKDLSIYNQLIFYVKGDKSGHTSKFKIELKNGKGEVGRYLVTGITDYWQRILVPFVKFTDITDWRKMTEFVIIFDDATVTKKIGAVYIDDIYFQ